MKEVLCSLAISFSMYSKIPMPQIAWNEKNTRYVICFFPLVGVLVGLFEAAVFEISRLLSFPDAVTAAFLIAVPLLLTGGIHADGFLDTSDALSSYRTKEERLLILKDPHIGAFGVIRFALYLLLLFGFVSLCLKHEKQIPALLPVFVFLLSRILSGLSAVFFPCAKKEGTLFTFSGKGVKKTVRIVMLAELFACLLGMLLLAPGYGVLLLLGNGLLFLYYYRMAKKAFGGITGDLAGWFLCMSELVSAAAFACSAILGW